MWKDTLTMQDHNDDLTTQTTGRGYNRQSTDQERAGVNAASDLYSPVPGDDDNTRPGMVGDSAYTAATAPTSRIESRTTPSRSTTTTSYSTDDRERLGTRSDAYTMRPRSYSDSGMMHKIQQNPLAVVAAATAGGMLLGRMMRNRNQRDNHGYMRATRMNHGYQAYQPSYGYQQPSFRQYQPPTDYRGYQGQGFQQGGYQGYQPAPGVYGAPQYRAEQEFDPEQQFDSRHENFRSGSHWD
jgi:hypothetical protein